MLFQRQGLSNLYGICSLNNALGKVCFLPAQLDSIADQLWFEAILRIDDFAAPVPATRFCDGKLCKVDIIISFPICYCSLQHSKGHAADYVDSS